MTPKRSLSEKIRRDDPLSPRVDALLRLGTPLYRLGMLFRSWRSAVSVNARVISFGNITVGGTGKTPAVIERAREEIDLGHRVAILTRGYGAPDLSIPLVAIRGSDAASMWRVVGDEPALIAHKVPSALIVRGKDRVAGARMAVEQHGCDVLILDDGFQYIQLARDENIAVIDASNPFGNRRLLPRGILREPILALARATHFLLTHCDRAPENNVGELQQFLQSNFGDRPIRTTRHAPGSLWNIATRKDDDIGLLNGARVTAVCAIAHPESFMTTLTSLGADIVEQRVFADHKFIPVEALRADGIVVTTEKDAVRIDSAPDNVFALSIRLEDWP